MRHNFIEGTFYSWTVITPCIADKLCDKSLFEYNESGIPREVRKFFGIEELEYPNKQEITLEFNNTQYEATLTIDKKDRAKILWYKKLADEFSSYNNIPDITLRFQKQNVAYYNISMIVPGNIPIQSVDLERMRQISHAYS